MPPATMAQQAQNDFYASEAEMADHARVLAAIDKETKGGCLWLAEQAQAVSP